MEQTAVFNVPAKKLDGEEITEYPLQIVLSVIGVYAPEDRGVVADYELIALVKPWLDLFSSDRPLERWIQKPIAANVALFVATHIERIADRLGVIEAFRLSVTSVATGESFTVDSRQDLKQLTSGGPWREHTRETYAALMTEYPTMFNADELEEAQAEIRSGRRSSNNVVNQIRRRRLAHLLKGGGALSVED